MRFDPVPASLLFYDKPAEYWEAALPLGNGRLGAMVFGGVEREVLSLNEDTLWSGLPGLLRSCRFRRFRFLVLFHRNPQR